MTTPDNITALKPKEIFVFGSNRRGCHDGGAARIALDKFGAIYGQADGLQGQSFAIPTLTGTMTRMSLKNIGRYAKEFSMVAAGNPDLTFYLTKVGCGIAGFSESEIAPLFADMPKNVIKPEGW